MIVDFVGCCGIWRKRQCKVGSREWLAARQAVTQDVNAAVEALQRLGYPEIIVKDIHGGGYNLKKAILIPRATYESGIALKPVPLLGKMLWANCAVLLGFHARAGASDGFFAHTFLEEIERVDVNGRPVGEAELMAGLLGELGIPVTCLTGDATTVQQARDLIPWLEILEVPKDRANNLALKGGGTNLLRKRNEIRALVERACKPKVTFRRFQFETPTHFRVKFASVDRARFFNSWGMQQVDNEVSWISKDFVTGYRQLVHLLYVPRPLVGLAPSLYKLTSWFNRAIYSVV